MAHIVAVPQDVVGHLVARLQPGHIEADVNHVAPWEAGWDHSGLFFDHLLHQNQGVVRRQAQLDHQKVYRSTASWT